ncbi:transcription termination/antitermination protein NusG [Magnetospirillum fulvum]|uniref:NusG-like N-terminal domain-containing protein n=1 Tax=Magnetospirillum fulvum MGU-K5 TaxID=1316936 RepID=S9SCC5_MAGFU|nr:transcriptional activator RfaH [Magnetospirillum fulvum]EPY01733.1 hypothetical protein K678_09423 [Magnetospirillum fulvum MGU-K5]
MQKWYVVRAKPRSENLAATHLARQGFRVFLPQYTTTVKHARRSTHVHRPLFPGYLFVGFDRETARWRSILGTIGVLDLIRNGDHPVSVPENVVEGLIAEGGENGLIQRAEDVLRPGSTVRITEGPFALFVGRLLSLNDKERTTVLLSVMNREIEVLLPRESIEATP